jgi:hypothetical protein
MELGMAQDIVRIEPLAVPDRRQPAQMPSLPEWVVSRLESLQRELAERQERFGLAGGDDADG